MTPSTRASLFATAIALVTAGCSSSSVGDASFVPGAAGGFANAGSPGSGSSGAATLSPEAGLPPEIKAESTYQSPVATGKIVWTANPTSGRVAYVDATSFSVQTAQAGDGPTYLAAVPNPSKGAGEAAIVINARSHNATRLRRDEAGGLTPTTFSLTADANSWAMSPSGRWAIAWTDAARVPKTDSTQGFQDVAVLDLWAASPADAGSQILAVGYRPSQVVFSQESAMGPSGQTYETRAFAVTEDGISVIDLRGGQPVVTQNFSLSAPIAADASTPETSTVDASATEASPVDAFRPETSVVDADDAEAGALDAAFETSLPNSTNGPPSGATSGMPDVSFTPDGSYALVRQGGVAAITVISLKDGSPTRVALPSAPTDLAVAPDGTFAVAVLREMATVAVLPLPAIANDPTSLTMTTIDGEVVGRAIVAEDMTTRHTSVLLFTTAAPIERLTVLTLQPTPSFRTIALHAPVLAVFPTNDAKTAIVLHNVNPTAGSGVNGAFSIVPIEHDLPPKIVSLGAPPIAVALAPTSDRALVMVSDKTSTFGVDLAMMPSLEVIAYTLASPPTAVGIAVAAGNGFVAQDYSDGRITFIDLSGGAARTITGFELGARVVQGSNP